MLYPNGSVKVVSNVNWLDNVTDKPTQNPKPTHDRPTQSELRAKRSKTSASASRQKHSRERDASAEVDEHLASIRLPRSAIPASDRPRTRSAARAAANAPDAPEVSKDVSTATRVEILHRPPDPSEVPQTSQARAPKPVPRRPTIRSTSQPQSQEEPLDKNHIRHLFPQLSPHPLAFLARYNTLESFKPRLYMEAMADSYRKTKWQLDIQDEADSLITNK